MGYRGKCKAKRIQSKTGWSAILYYNGLEDSLEAKRLVEESGIDHLALRVDVSPLEDHQESTLGRLPILVLGLKKTFIGLSRIKEIFKK
ncbi:MAG: hypothetical protein HY764_03580 [Candidatus Portnoybacteria bacterium]|nr:hypothetical protein [Candidatus Portnoybacteria bacterium]